MARLHEYQGKALLDHVGINIPHGRIASTPEEARQIAQEIAGPVFLKAQIWQTGRAKIGAIKKADTPQMAEQLAETLLGMQVDQFNVEALLVEEKLAIAREFYASLIIDDRVQAPLLMFSSVGGTGIEEIATQHPENVATYPIDIRTGMRDFEARELVRQTGITGKLLLQLGDFLPRLYELARRYDARTAEVNPLVLTEAGVLVAVDCRITIDDYAVYRQPDLQIPIAREFGRPPTPLEEVAWQVENGDYRGTFYFVQMEQEFDRGERVVGFHGSGGGGSMMAMDALLNQGIRVANFVDTSGNPPASKVYRAARIILSQANIDGYFASGSGVASQEQFHSARGLAKAFLQAPLNVPAVIRIGGNAEAQAIEILERLREHLPVPIEAYGKDDSPDFCAGRLAHLLEQGVASDDGVQGSMQRDGDYGPYEAAQPYTFETVSGGTVTLDHERCAACESKICIESCVPQILSLQDDVPVLNIGSDEAARGGCTECLACEVECYFLGNRGGFVDLPIKF